MSVDDRAREPSMDPANLYREDTYTDRRVGTIRQLTPVKVDGSSDSSRTVIYQGEAQMLTAVGAVPLSFEIEAQSLSEAVQAFSAAAKQAVERTMRELQEMRREAASSIVIPDAGGGGLGGPGGVPGGGKIQLR